MTLRSILGASAAVLGLFSGHVLAEEEHHWGYAGEGDPSVWAELSDEYRACGTGVEQSPIDIDSAAAIPADYPDIAFHWQPFVPIVANNGHTIQINADGNGGYAMLGGKQYDLLQFHFHNLSEHTLDGEHTPMEAHFVHRSEAGDLLVIGLFVEEGAADEETIAAVWPLVPSEEGEATGTDPIDPTTMLPEGLGAYRYAGSLTTPPCSEVVTWHVLAQPVPFSKGQIETYLSLYEGNYRPVQPLNRRFVLAEGIEP